MRFILPSIFLVLAGCGQNQHAAVVAPTPIAVVLVPTPTAIVIQSNEAPPSALPEPVDSSVISVPQALPPSRVRGTIPTAKTKLAPRLSSEERNYISKVSLVNQLMQPPPQSNDSPEVYLEKARANMQRASELLESAPPRFNKANSMLRVGVKQAKSAIDDAKLEASFGLTWEQSKEKTLQKLGDADVLLNAGYAEVKRSAVISR